MGQHVPHLLPKRLITVMVDSQPFVWKCQSMTRVTQPPQTTTTTTKHSHQMSRRHFLLHPRPNRWSPTPSRSLRNRSEMLLWTTTTRTSYPSGGDRVPRAWPSVWPWYPKPWPFRLWPGSVPWWDCGRRSSWALWRPPWGDEPAFVPPLPGPVRSWWPPSVPVMDRHMFRPVPF